MAACALIAMELPSRIISLLVSHSSICHSRRAAQLFAAESVSSMIGFHFRWEMSTPLLKSPMMQLPWLALRASPNCHGARSRLLRPTAFQSSMAHDGLETLSAANYGIRAAFVGI